MLTSAQIEAHPHATPIEHCQIYSEFQWNGKIWRLWDTEHQGDIVSIRSVNPDGTLARHYKRIPWGTSVLPIIPAK